MNNTLSDPLDASVPLQTTSSQAGNSGHVETLAAPKVRAPIPQSTGQVEVDINMFMAKVEQNHSIGGEMASMFQSAYGLDPSDMAKIWYAVSFIQV